MKSLAHEAEEGAMKKASEMIVLFFAFAVLVAPARSQEKSWGFRIPVVGAQIGGKVQSPIPLSSRPRIDGTYSPSTMGAQQASSTNAARGRQRPSPAPNQGTVIDPGTRVGRSVIIPPGTKHTAPNFKDVLIGLSFGGAYDKNVAAKVQEEVGKRGAYFTDSCDPRPIVCFVVHNPGEPAGTFRSDGSGSWNGERSSNWGSSSETGNFYGVTISAHLLADDGNEYLGDKSEGFRAVTHSSQYSANSNYGNRGGNASQGGETITVDQDLAIQAGATKAARGMIGSFLKDKKRWRPGAAQLVREAFGQP